MHLGNYCLSLEITHANTALQLAVSKPLNQSLSQWLTTVTVVLMSRCSCRAGFDGPRCQQTRHSFSGGDSWALYPALSLCSHSHTSLELMTLYDNALVMYHGPVTDALQPGQATDYILLELRNGYPMLRVDHGSGLSAMNSILLQPTTKKYFTFSIVYRFHVTGAAGACTTVYVAIC